ncbi:hypothetical protein, partial [Pseudomonas ogarae]|uniref:hypothetical protein n=1 Tax=Pseudomonas ogarae (strain DSM 112162 / CECT 30235 / F113) TaxID=1114970 RepID=UPI00194E364D
DEKGQKYRFHSDLHNAEIAVLAMVHFQQRQLATHTAGAAMDAWFDLIRIRSGRLLPFVTLGPVNHAQHWPFLARLFG